LTDLDAIRERHFPVPYPGDPDAGYCVSDGDRWPCDTAQALARVAELEAALSDVWDAVYDSGSEERVRALLARPEPKP
jgi:hypothetical protein